MMDAKQLEELMKLADLYAVSYANYVLNGGQEQHERSRMRRQSLLHALLGIERGFVTERRCAERRRCEDED